MWDQKYATKDYVYGTQPSTFLTKYTHLLTPSARALVLADGEGRNSVFLAEQGLDVLAMDSSHTGLTKARELARHRSVQVTFQQADIRDWDWTTAQFDVVAAVFIQFADTSLQDQIFAGIDETLNPGGLLLLHGFSVDQFGRLSGGPPVAEFLYEKEKLAARFADWDLLHLSEYEADLDEGAGHNGRAALIDLVVRKR